MYETLKSRLGGRGKMSATIISFVLVAIVILTSYVFFDSLVSGTRTIGTQLENNDFPLPPPSEKVADWPLIGEKTYKAWKLASENLDAALEKYDKQLSAIGKMMLNSALGTGLGVLQFILSIIIAGILLATSDKGSLFARNFFRKIVGEWVSAAMNLRR